MTSSSPPAADPVGNPWTGRALFVRPPLPRGNAAKTQMVAPALVGFPFHFFLIFTY